MLCVSLVPLLMLRSNKDVAVRGKDGSQDIEHPLAKGFVDPMLQATCWT